MYSFSVISLSLSLPPSLPFPQSPLVGDALTETSYDFKHAISGQNEKNFIYNLLVSVFVHLENNYEEFEVV